MLAAGTGTEVNSTDPGHIYNIHYAGGNSLSDRGLVDLNLKNFGPHVGLAYQAYPKTVIRSGYGISYAYLFRMGGEGLLAYNGPNNYDATLPSNQTPSQGLCTSLTQVPTTCFRRTQDGYQPTSPAREFLYYQGADSPLAEGLQAGIRAGVSPFCATGDSLGYHPGNLLCRQSHSA